MVAPLIVAALTITVKIGGVIYTIYDYDKTKNQYLEQGDSEEIAQQKALEYITPSIVSQTIPAPVPPGASWLLTLPINIGRAFIGKISQVIIDNSNRDDDVKIQTDAIELSDIEVIKQSFNINNSVSYTEILYPLGKVINGTDKDDTLLGANPLLGVGGDDTLIGGNDNDVLIGKGGHDNLYGDFSNICGLNAGNDILNGGSGTNKLYGGNGKDVYIIDTFDRGVNTIEDADKEGRILQDYAFVLARAYKQAGGFYTDDLNNRYTLQNGDLVIKGSINATIKNFQNGDLGITLKDKRDSADEKSYDTQLPDGYPIPGTLPGGVMPIVECPGKDNFTRAEGFSLEVSGRLDPLILDINCDGFCYQKAA